MSQMSAEQLCGPWVSPPARVFANNSATSPQHISATGEAISLQASYTWHDSNSFMAKVKCPKRAKKKRKEIKKSSKSIKVYKSIIKTHLNTSKYHQNTLGDSMSTRARPQQHLPLLLHCFCASVEKTLGLYRSDQIWSDNPYTFADHPYHIFGWSDPYTFVISTRMFFQSSNDGIILTETTTLFQLWSELGPRFGLWSKGMLKRDAVSELSTWLQSFTDTSGVWKYLKVPESIWK